MLIYVALQNHEIVTESVRYWMRGIPAVANVELIPIPTPLTTVGYSSKPKI